MERWRLRVSARQTRVSARSVCGALTLLLLAGPSGIHAQGVCRTRCNFGEIQDAVGCCVSAEAGTGVLDDSQASCADGQVRQPGTARCCWVGQAWSGQACRGIPSRCPAGFAVSGETCVLLECPEGRERANDNVSCCWIGQDLIEGRCRGIPTSCPPNHQIVGEQCSDEAYRRSLLEQQSLEQAEAARRAAELRAVAMHRAESERRALQIAEEAATAAERRRQEEIASADARVAGQRHGVLLLGLRNAFHSAKISGARVHDGEVGVSLTGILEPLVVSDLTGARLAALELQIDAGGGALLYTPSGGGILDASLEARLRVRHIGVGFFAAVARLRWSDEESGVMSVSHTGYRVGPSVSVGDLGNRTRKARNYLVNLRWAIPVGNNASYTLGNLELFGYLAFHPFLFGLRLGWLSQWGPFAEVIEAGLTLGLAF